MDTKQQLIERLLPFDQQHIVDGWDSLTNAERAQLAAQVQSIDLELIRRLFHESEAHEDFGHLAARAEPPPAIRLHAQDNPFRADHARACGSEALAAGQIGVALVAGGQGSRLGFEHPKGMFSIGPLSGASLFQIHFEKVLALGRRYGVTMPIYLMTSPATDAETRDYLAQYDRFGLPAEDLFIFCQGTMPAVDAHSGRLLLDRPGHLFASPDGHGGMLAALKRSSALDDMHRRGLQQIFYFQVDNPLTMVCDLEFIGYHLLAESEYSLQVVAKTEPQEKVGNVVSADGHSRVIEYSDLPDEAAEQSGPDGSLKFWAGSIAVHVFDVDFLRREADQEAALPFHRALKKVPYVDAKGRVVEPDTPNAIKYERFIFDLLPLAERSISVEIDPAVGFAPLKNAAGAATYTPESVQRLMLDLHRKWLRKAGAGIEDSVRVEISPLYALDAEQLAEKLPAETTIHEDKYLR